MTATSQDPQIIKTIPERAANYDWISLESEFKKIESFGDCQKSHSGLKPYSCSICSHSFSTLSKLKQHIKEHDTVSETRPYKCTDCSRKFSQPRNIHRHMVLSHGKPETTGPFTLALMSPERIPFTDKNCQGERGRKRPLEELHKSAFTPVAKSPNTSPDGKLTPPAKVCRNGNPTKLFITNVKSLREENPFPDITPLDSPDSGKLKIKEEKKSPRHHPYTKPSPTKTSSRQPPRLAPKPPQYAIVQAVNLPTLHAFNVKIERQTSSPPAAVTSAPHVAVPKSRPVTSSHTAVSTAQPSPPARIHTPETLHSITMVDQIRYAAVMTSFDHLVQGYLAHRTYQSLKCFYKCLTTAKQSVELGTMPW
ncbi:zinc finger protein 629-like [Bolinopsis microptera]|uniref:zinc finger protein 629-like n=1 Tax=Bolinopsis microptera TaxID=2820187 RepID=UPI003078FB31